MATRASHATKSDVSEVRDEVRLLREELHDTRDTLRAELHEVRDALRDELKADIRAVGVMVESLRSNMSVIAEGFSAMATKSELAEVDERLSARTAFLTGTVRDLAADVRKTQRTPGGTKR